MLSFEKTVAYLRENYPDQFIIADAKRGDIGNTSEMYARSFFDHIKVDAVTVAPYMGEDSVKPVPDLSGSLGDPAGTDLQQRLARFPVDGRCQRRTAVRKGIEKSQDWATDEQMMYVVGATQGKMFLDIRKHAPNHFLLVPGVGAQGRKPRRSGSVRHERPVRITGKLFPCYHICRQNGEFCQRSA